MKIHDEKSYVSGSLLHTTRYLSTTTKLRQTHITTVVGKVSCQLSGMAVCTPISLAITAHELSFPFAFSPLDAHILIDVGGIDIYYLRQKRMGGKEEDMT